MDQHVFRPDRAHHLAVVGGEVLEPAIGGLDEDLGLEAGVPEHAIDPEHLVANRVPVAERREHLVHASLAHADRLLFLLSWLPLLLWWLPPLLSWLPPPRSWLPPPLSWLPPVGGLSLIH